MIRRVYILNRQRTAPNVHSRHLCNLKSIITGWLYVAFFVLKWSVGATSSEGFLVCFTFARITVKIMKQGVALTGRNDVTLLARRAMLQLSYK